MSPGVDEHQQAVRYFILLCKSQNRRFNLYLSNWNETATHVFEGVVVI